MSQEPSAHLRERLDYGPAAPDLRALLAAIDRVESSAEELEREIDASDRHVYLAWLRRSIADLRRVAGRQ